MPLIYLLLKSVIKTSDSQAVSYRLCQWNRNFVVSTRVFWWRFEGNIWIWFTNQVEKLVQYQKLALSSTSKDMQGTHECYRHRKFKQSRLSSCISTRKIYDDQRHHYHDFTTNVIKLTTFQPVLKCAITENLWETPKAVVNNQISLFLAVILLVYHAFHSNWNLFDKNNLQINISSHS